MSIITKKGLLISLNRGVYKYHQKLLIDSIEISIHYNYLVDRYYLDIFVDDEYRASNIPILPNVDLFKGLYFVDRNDTTKSIGTLIFSADPIRILSITKDTLFNRDVQIIYFKEPTLPLMDNK